MRLPKLVGLPVLLLSSAVFSEPLYLVKDGKPLVRLRPNPEARRSVARAVRPNQQGRLKAAPQLLGPHVPGLQQRRLPGCVAV